MGRLLAGSVMRIVVTGATLAAIYFFVLKPILDTTEKTVGRGLDTSTDIQRQIREATRDAGVSSFAAPEPNQDSLRSAQKTLRCIQKANNDVEKIQACATP